MTPDTPPATLPVATVALTPRAIAARMLPGATSTAQKARIRRGAEYVGLGAVGTLDIVGPGQLSCLVRGSRDPYRVTLSFTPPDEVADGGGRWVGWLADAPTMTADMPLLNLRAGFTQGTCDCPDDGGGWCKHRWAVGLRLAQLIADDPEPLAALFGLSVDGLRHDAWQQVEETVTAQVGTVDPDAVATAGWWQLPTRDGAHAAEGDVAGTGDVARTLPQDLAGGDLAAPATVRGPGAVAGVSSTETAVQGPVTVTDAALIEAVPRQAPVSASGVARHLGAEESRDLNLLREQLRRLERDGRLRRTGRTKGTRWQPSDRP